MMMKLLSIFIGLFFLNACSSTVIGGVQQGYDYEILPLSELRKKIEMGVYREGEEPLSVGVVGQASLYIKQQVLFLEKGHDPIESHPNYEASCLQLLVPSSMLDQVSLGQTHTYEFKGELIYQPLDYVGTDVLFFTINGVDVVPTCAQKNDLFLFVHQMVRR